jgi:hypothetical protein
MFSCVQYCPLKYDTVIQIKSGKKDVFLIISNKRKHLQCTVSEGVSEIFLLSLKWLHNKYRYSL